VIGDHDHLLLVRQIDPNDRTADRHQSAQPIQARVAVAVTPGHTTTVTQERPPPAMGHQARSASGGRASVLHRHAERLSMPRSARERTEMPNGVRCDGAQRYAGPHVHPDMDGPKSVRNAPRGSEPDRRLCRPRGCADLTTGSLSRQGIRRQYVGTIRAGPRAARLDATAIGRRRHAYRIAGDPWPRHPDVHPRLAFMSMASSGTPIASSAISSAHMPGVSERDPWIVPTSRARSASPAGESATTSAQPEVGTIGVLSSLTARSPASAAIPRHGHVAASASVPAYVRKNAATKGDRGC
jgi:hypothetical protein